MTEYLTVEGGTLAYETAGAHGPLIVLAHGMGDSREAFRFLMPMLAAAGYRVAALDLRGCGESSVGWDSCTRTDLAGDLLALVRELGGPAVLIGHSISGGAVTIAAAQAPSLVSAVVELAPFTRAQSIRFGDLRVARFRRGMFLVLAATLFGSVRLWRGYLKLAYPGVRPSGWEAAVDRIGQRLREPGRMKALRQMGRTSPADAGEHLGAVECPVLIVQGELDPDWASPRAEGEAIVAALPAGLGRLAMLAGAGHYPHVQYPAEVFALVQPFLESAHV